MGWKIDGSPTPIEFRRAQASHDKERASARIKGTEKSSQNRLGSQVLCRCAAVFGSSTLPHGFKKNVAACDQLFYG
jgi:hypothetical protein